MRAAYQRLHDLGHAHSLEVWAGAELVGGLYGVAVGGVFTGESMFHLATDASKVALVDLADRLAGAGGRLIDVQMVTPTWPASAPATCRGPSSSTCWPRSATSRSTCPPTGSPWPGSPRITLCAGR